MSNRWGILGLGLGLLLQAAALASVPAGTKAALLRAPLRFEPNFGQADAQVRFLARGTGYGLFLTDEEMVMRFADGSADGSPSAVLRVRLEGSLPAHPHGRLAQPGRSHYLVLDASRPPISNVPHYSELVQRDRYPGIDVVTYGNNGQIEYDFVLAPGADPAQIAIAIEGVDTLSIAENGDLHITIAGRTFVQRAPVSFQYADSAVAATPDATRLRHGGSARIAVASRYVIGDDGCVRFELGGYDRQRPLVIDPVFAYGTYIGGSLDDDVLDIAVNAAGEVYATGYTFSTNFPLANALDPSHGGGMDAFLLKLDATGSNLVFSTYLGGTGDQIGQGVALDASGRPYIAGLTKLVDADGDAFVVRLSAQGNAAEYSRTFGGALMDEVLALVVDPAGQAVVTGHTESTDFPTVNPIHGHLGARECFLARLNAADGLLNYSTYVGGPDDQSCEAVGYHAASGFAYIGGTSKRFDPAGDAFVIKINFDASFTNGDWSRTIQTSGEDAGTGLAVDGAGNVWLVGHTGAENFPQMNPLQGRGGSDDVFVVRYDAAGNLTLASYLGSSATEYAADAALDASGRLYIVGSYFGFEYSALVYRLAPNGSGIQWQGAFGGGAQATAAATDGSAAYIGGGTNDWSATTPTSLYSSPRGGRDGILAKLVEGTANVRVVDRAADETSANIVVTISVEPPSLLDIPMYVHEANGTALYTVDYTFGSTGIACHSLTTWVDAGRSTYTCRSRIVHDTLDEDDEHFFVRIQNVVNANVVDAEGRITILDNDPSPALTISDASTPEGSPCAPGSAVFTVTLSTASGRVVDVPWATGNGTALAGSDYTAASGTLRFEPGETSNTITVPVLTDLSNEANQTFFVNLTAPATATLADGQGVATIINSAFPTLAIGDISAAEGTGTGGTLNFNVTSTPAVDCAFSVGWTTASGTASSADFVAASGTLSFAANQTSRPIAVALMGDALDEPDETLLVNLVAPAWGVLGDGAATGTINDDDPTPTLSIDNGGCSVTEGNAGTINCPFVIRLSAISGRAVSFTSATANGTATAGSDYTAHSSIGRTLNPGLQALTVLVPVLGDGIDEPNETFALNLTAVTNATPGSLAGTGNIVDDDVPEATGSLRMRDAVLQVGETAGSLQVVVERVGGSGGNASVNYLTSNGTAVAGLDYGAASGTLTWPSGDASPRTLTLTIINDPAVEAQESFMIGLSQADGASLGSPISTTITIVDGAQLLHVNGFE